MSSSRLSDAGVKIAPLIDHTLLKPEATHAQIITLCRDAIQFGFAAVCVQSRFVRLVARELAGSRVRVATVAGFPHGASSTAIKSFEAADAVANGAHEVDMVLAVGALKDQDYAYVRDDIRAVVEAADGRWVKVILETCLLTDDEKRKACELVVEAGAHFVKTSTGLSTGGATVADVQLMRQVVGPAFGVKASGGIKTLAETAAMIAAGANRIGTSSGVEIVRSDARATA